MVTKKNIAIIFAMTQIVFLSHAMGQNNSLKELYRQIVQLQGNNNPFLSDRQTSQCSLEYLLYPFLINARETGLIAQYQKMLSTKDGIEEIEILYSPKCLLWTAYLQNQHGQGEPFKYDGKGNKKFIVFGDYQNPQRKNITITRYSFLDGILEQLDNATGPLQANGYFQKIKNTMKRNLSQAILQSINTEKGKTPEDVCRLQLETLKGLGYNLIQKNDMQKLRMFNVDLKKIIDKY